MQHAHDTDGSRGDTCTIQLQSLKKSSQDADVYVLCCVDSSALPPGMHSQHLLWLMLVSYVMPADKCVLMLHCLKNHDFILAVSQTYSCNQVVLAIREARAREGPKLSDHTYRA